MPAPRLSEPAHLDFLLRLLECPSPTGHEEAGQRLWASHLKSFADRVDNDAYGNAWAVLEGKGGASAPTLMIESHADEIGFAVRQIGSDGFLRIDRVGGSDVRIARGRRAVVLGDRGPVEGIVGNVAMHLRESKDDKYPEWHEVWIDVGAANPKQVAALGIRVGTPGIYAGDFRRIGPHGFTGRALDNRIGGYIAALVMEKLAKGPRPHATVVALNAVQEEIGGNGARMAAHRLRPSLAVVLDVTHATDTPGVSKEKHGDVKLGAGPTVTHSPANHKTIVRRLLATAAKARIPVQHESGSRVTGTDTDEIFVSRSGVPSALVSIPLRYMHSPVELVDLRDVARAADLLAAFARSVRSSDEFTTRFA